MTLDRPPRPTAPQALLEPLQVLRPSDQAAVESFDRLPDSALMRKQAVAALLGVSAPTLFRWSKSGHLQPVRLAANVTAFKVGDIRRFIASRGG